MEKIISYDRTLHGTLKSSLDRDHWKYVTDQWDQKNYKNAIIGTLEYINRDAINKYGNADKTEFKVPHGSIIVEVKITDTEFIVKAPFLGLPEGPKVPLLRQVAQLNFHPLKLSNIVLENEQLSFQYKGSIDTCEPYKVYDILSEITYFADNHDDEFIKKFNAKRLYNPEVGTYDSATVEKSWTRFKEIVDECNQYIAHFENKRLQYFVWDIVSITLRKIEYFLSPQGFLRFELEKAINDLMNQNFSINDKIAKGKEFMIKLTNYDKAAFEADFYKPVIFVPYKTSSSLENIKKSLESNLTRFNEEYNKRDFLGAAYTGLYAIYDLFYIYDMQDDIRSCLESALETSQGKSYEEACVIYRSTFDQIQTGNFNTNAFVASRSDTKDNVDARSGGGFFKKIFGN
jgi:hypothetical protein